MEQTQQETTPTTSKPEDKLLPDEPYNGILEAAYKQLYEIGSTSDGWTEVKTDLGVKISKRTIDVHYLLAMLIPLIMSN